MATIRIDKKLLREWKEEDEEARTIRRQEADWEFIKAQPSSIREALEFYVEHRRLASQESIEITIESKGMTT